jgi:hypothetical protein
MGDYDFSGWATRNDLLCGDGRTIRKNAFKDCDGQVVPLVYNHDHNDPNAVLGHALLENRENGVYAYGKFNDTEQGRTAKELVQHGDVRSLSIYANKLKQMGGDVVHGVIRELSLVLAGANPGAYIDFVMAHSDDSEDGDSLYADYDECALMIYHSDTKESTETKKEDNSMAEEAKKDTQSGEKTVKDVFDSMTEEQKTVVYAMIGQALEDAGATDDEDVEHSDYYEEGDDYMKHNVFDREEATQKNTLSHSDQQAILALAAQPGVASLQKAIEIYCEQNDSLAHGFVAGADGVEALFPEHELITPGAPKLLRDMEQDWVMGVISKIKKSPYARIRTRYADARISELKADYAAKGYNDRASAKKLTDAIKIIGRKTEPTTIYLKDELHRDDITDIEDFDVVNYIWNFMKENYYETLALAALVGDGREDTDPDKISEENIRPIWKDNELYTIHADVDFEKAKAEIQGSNTSANFSENYIYAEAMIMASLYAREKFKGSGTPDLYCAPHLVNVMLLARDLNGRRIYDSKADLARALNVNSIVEIEQLEGRTRTDAAGKEKKLIGLFVNLADYQFGSAKGGELAKFSDFDIDYNKYKYLMEGRCSGSLTALKSAIALEEPVESAAG